MHHVMITAKTVYCDVWAKHLIIIQKIVTRYILNIKRINVKYEEAKST